MQRDNLFFIAAVALITAVAFFLRLYHLDFQCMTWDEEFTCNLAITNTSYILAFSWTVDPNPPLYYLIAHHTINLLGNTDWALRLPAAIFSTLTIPVVYLIGTEYRNRVLGLVMASTLTITYTMIFYGQFARAYALVFLFFAISVYAFQRIERDGGWPWYLLMTASCVVCLWSHAFSIIPIGIMFAFLIWKHGKEMLLWSVLLALNCSPYLYYIVVMGKRSHEYFGQPPWMLVYLTPLEMLWVPGFVIVAYCIYRVARTGIPQTGKDLLPVMAIATYIGVIVISVLNPVFPRYALLVTPLMLLPFLDYLVAFTEQYQDTDRRVVILLVWIFIVGALSYTPLIAWYFMDGCMYLPKG